MGYKAWRTPTKPGSVWHELNKDMHFTLDAAASIQNALCDRFCTEYGKWEMEAVVTDTPLGEIISSTVPSLLEEGLHGLNPGAWQDEDVWCNPPYDDILPWAFLANMRVAHTSTLLLPPSIDTEWFDALWVKPDDKSKDKMVVVTRDTPEYHAILWQTADRDGIWPNREMRFMRKRIRFLRPKRNIEIWDEGTLTLEPDETDTESVVGESPRAGNLVVITYAAR